MARYSFSIFGANTGEPLSNLLIEIKDQNSTIVASTNPTGGQLQIYDMGNGNYYVDDLPFGKYDFYINGILQDEMDNKIIIDETIINHIGDNTIHHLIDDNETDTGMLWSSDKINTELNLRVLKSSYESDKTDLQNQINDILNKLGNMDFVGTEIIEDAENLTHALRQLDGQVFSNYMMIRRPEINNPYVIYQDASTHVVFEDYEEIDRFAMYELSNDSNKITFRVIIDCTNSESGGVIKLEFHGDYPGLIYTQELHYDDVTDPYAENRRKDVFYLPSNSSLITECLIYAKSNEDNKQFIFKAIHITRNE